MHPMSLYFPWFWVFEREGMNQQSSHNHPNPLIISTIFLTCQESKKYVNFRIFPVVFPLSIIGSEERDFVACGV